MLTAEIP